MPFFFLFLLVICHSSCHRISPGMQIDQDTSHREKYLEVSPYGWIPIVEICPDSLCEINAAVMRECNFGFSKWEEMNRPYEYRVDVGDALSIMVWGHPELNNPTNSSANFEQLGFVVGSRGTIFYPYVGEIEVRGKNVDVIRELVQDKLRAFVIDPMVSVNVLNYRSQFVNVIGEINLPAQIPVSDVPLTALDAISRAGGATFNGDLQNIVIKREEKLSVVNLLPRFSSSTKIPFLAHGDIVYVPNKINNQIYILGEVRMPQAIVMDSDIMTLSNAIARASGVDPMASKPELCFVFRQDNEGRKIAYHLDARSPAALLLANDFILQRQDIVYVGTYEPALLNRIMTNFLSTTRVITDLSWSASNINDCINRYNTSTFNKNSDANEVNN